MNDYKNILLNSNPKGLSEKHIRVAYPELYEYVMSHYPDDLTFKERIYWYLHNINDYPRCACGNRLNLRSLTYGYNQFCSYRCVVIYTKDKARQTNLKRYGVENPACLQQIKEARKRTNLERYGTENTFQSHKEKIKQTNLERYGVDHPSKSKELMEKKCKNNLEKYGVEHTVLLDSVREKIKASNDIYYMKMDPDIIGFTEDHNRIMRCPHEGCQGCQEKQYIISTQQYYARKEFNIEPCTHLLKVQHSRSKNTWIEKFVKDILDEHKIEYVENVRNILKGKELDIYIPSRSLAIECNGVFWHSDRIEGSSRHKDKYEECKKLSIQLLTLWEDQFIHKPDIIRSIILSKLGIYERRIYARNCIIREIDSRTCSNFLNNNHLQGSCNTSVRLGVFHMDELVSVMTFNKRSKLSGNASDGWELNRFCAEKNTQVVGIASKLLKCFVRLYHPISIISFASCDISDGSLYKKLGFEEDNHITEAYWYIEKGTYKRFHRSHFTKQHLKKMGYDTEGKTEKDIMKNLPYYRIYDSGHIKYTFKIDI